MKRVLIGMLTIVPMLFINSTKVDACYEMSSHWAAGSVSELSSEGIVSGYLDGTFRPENHVKREEASKMIAVALELLSNESSSNDFDYKNFHDIKGRWSETFIHKLVGKSIINGYPDGSFRPENDITRSEYSVVISKLLKKFRNIESNSYYFNDTYSHWASDDISSLHELNLLNGYSNGDFRPDNNITRAEASEILNKTMNLIRGKKVEQKVVYDSNQIAFQDNIDYAPISSQIVNNIEPEAASYTEKNYVEAYYVPQSYLDSIYEGTIQDNLSSSNGAVKGVMEQVNYYRRAAGLRDLVWCDNLGYNAQIRAEELHISFSHTRPNGQRGIDMIGYAGENIAYNYSESASEVTALWYNSQGHRENMLDPEWTRIGVGMCEINGVNYWVQFFSN